MENIKYNILNRCFTKNWIQGCINDNNPTYDEIIRRYIPASTDKTNMELIESIYSLMLNNYRNEYIYKNTLINKLLLKKHSLKTTTALSEFQIAGSIADMIMINGRGIVYEIKTELDNYDRLDGQINDYYKAFSYVYIVTHKNNMKSLMQILDTINPNVGILVFNRTAFTEYRKASCYNELLDKEVIFKILRKHEFENVIMASGFALPSCSQFKYYQECKAIFNEIPIDKLQKLSLETLKARSRVTDDEIALIPDEMKFLCYSMNIKDKDRLLIDEFLNSKYKE